MIEKREIYRLNTSSNVICQVEKKCFELNDEGVYENIWKEWDLLQIRLSKKNLKYSKLKSALIPNQDKDRKEVCFIFDKNSIKSNFYGKNIIDVLLTLMDKDSTYSVLYGDYIDIIGNDKFLSEILKDALIKFNDYNYICSNQFFIVYINRLTSKQLSLIVDGMSQYKWFIGYTDVNNCSKFKSYISCILTNLCIKHKSTIIVSHPSDCLDEKDYDIKGYAYEENGFSMVSINEESFDLFLSYRIETEIIDDDDVAFSLNALFPKFDSFDKLILKIDDNKWFNYLIDKTQKGVIVQKIGFNEKQKEEFINAVYKKICCNYIYNLRQNYKYGVLMFDVCMEFFTENGNVRKTQVGLKYVPQNGEIYVLTIT